LGTGNRRDSYVCTHSSAVFHVQNLQNDVVGIRKAIFLLPTDSYPHVNTTSSSRSPLLLLLPRSLPTLSPNLRPNPKKYEKKTIRKTTRKKKLLGRTKEQKKTLKKANSRGASSSKEDFLLAQIACFRQSTVETKCD
jgi:hypothetical protein